MAGNSTVDVDIQTGRVRALVFQRPNSLAPRLLRKIARRIETNAKQKAPVGETGNLRRSIQIKPVEVGTEWASITVEATVSYAAVVHDGSKPYVIRPKAGRVGRNGRPAALKFKVGEKTVFARKVNHPGTRARPFLRNALNEELDRAGLT